MASELFAWQGFQLVHPEDWAPILLSGDRQEGYARIQGSGRIGCQIRWKRAKPSTNLHSTLADYFRLLEKDAKRNREAIRTETEVENAGRVAYRWYGAGQGRGFIAAGDCGRIFLVEVIGGRTDSLLPISRTVLGSFRSAHGSQLEAWALFGLCVGLPAGLSPASKELQAGRTWLTFRPRGAQIEVGRYAFGNELAQRHGLEDWARAALRLGSAECAAVSATTVQFVRPSRGLRRNVTALVRLDSDRNQLICIRSASNQKRWRPVGNWLECDWDGHTEEA